MDKSEKKRQRSDKGPWLLTEETLENIDAVMEKAFNQFSEAEKKKDEKHHSYIEKKLTIGFKDGTSADFKSFKEFAVSEIYSNLKPVQFSYEIDSTYNKINIALMDGWLDRSFQYYVRCEDDNLEDDFIYDINKIYNAAKPNELIMVISKFGILSWIIFLLSLVVIYFVQNNQYKVPIGNMTRNKIYQILSKEELAKEDYLDIIKYKTIYDMGFYSLMENDELIIVRNKLNKIWNHCLITGSLLCLILTTNPKATFAVGKNKPKVKFWKSYYRVIYYFIPVAIILPILISIVSQIIMKYL